MQSSTTPLTLTSVLKYIIELTPLNTKLNIVGILKVVQEIDS